MNRVAVGAARQDLAETLNRVAYKGERVVLHRRGRDVAAVVPLEDLRRLEDLEDREDVTAARRALADPNEKPIPLDDVRADLRVLDELEAKVGHEAALTELERIRAARSPAKPKARRR